MRHRPFLSYKRGRAAAVTELKQQLCIRGAGGWQDMDDLSLGADTIPAIVKAIESETGGFIWWATRDTLTSPVICKTELPTALARAERDPSYPIVPVFVELYPHERPAIEAAIGHDYARRLLGYNGVIRGTNQNLPGLARAAARRYVKQLVGALPPGPVEAAISAFREPVAAHDLSLDWRALFDADTRIPATGAVETFTEALGDIREALQGRARAPQVSVDINLPLPLAMLVGFQWRTTTQLRVTIKTINPDGRMLVVEPGTSADDRGLPDPVPATLTGDGPFVLAISVGADLGQTVDRYATEQHARGLERVHLPLPDDGYLVASAIRALAAHVARRLNALHAEGTPKHLLIRGPASLATAIGLAANGTGPTFVPFYDGHDGYISGVSIG